MSVRARLVLSTLCVFNAIILLILGTASLAFVDGRTRYVLAATMWIARGPSLQALARPAPRRGLAMTSTDPPRRRISQAALKAHRRPSQWHAPQWTP